MLLCCETTVGLQGHNAPHNAQGNGPVSMVITHAPEVLLLISAGSHFTLSVSSFQSIFLPSSLQSLFGAEREWGLNNRDEATDLRWSESEPSFHPPASLNLQTVKWPIRICPCSSAGHRDDGRRWYLTSLTHKHLLRSTDGRRSSNRRSRRSQRWGHGFDSLGMQLMRLCKELWIKACQFSLLLQYTSYQESWEMLKAI